MQTSGRPTSGAAAARTLRLRWTAVLLLTAAGAACQGTGGAFEAGAPDAGAFDAAPGDAGASEVAPDSTPPAIPAPTPPAAPRLSGCLDLPAGCAALVPWECAAGWHAVVADPLIETAAGPFAWCEPPPVPRLRAGGVVTPTAVDGRWTAETVCRLDGDGTVPQLSTESCVPLGDGCPESGWPELVPPLPAAVVYVREGGSGDGTTPAAPLPSIRAALRGAPAGATVLVAPGRYVETIRPLRDVTIRGACVTGVTIVSPDPPAPDDSGGTVVLDLGVHLRLENVRIQGDDIGINLTDAYARLDAAGVWIDGAVKYGARHRAGQASYRGLVITDMRPPAAGADAWGYGRGLHARAGARVEVAGGLVERCHYAAFVALDEGTEISLSDVVVRALRPVDEARDPSAAAVRVEYGARLEWRRGLAVDCAWTAALTWDDGSELVLEDLVVANTDTGDIDGRAGPALAGYDGGRLDARRVLVDGNTFQAVAVGSADSVDEAPFARATLTDVVVRGTRARLRQGPVGDPTEDGVAVLFAPGGGGTLDRVLLESNAVAGVQVGSAGALAALTDTVIRAVVPGERTGQAMGGVALAGRAAVSLTRVTVDDCAGAGLSLKGASSLAAAQLLVRATQPAPAAPEGRAHVVVTDGSSATLTDARLADGSPFGVLLRGEGSAATLTDVAVDGIVGDLDGRWGGGVGVTDGTSLTAERVRISGAHTVALAVEGPGATATLADVTLQGTQPQASDGGFGRAVTARAGATVTLVRALVDGAHDAGVQADGQGTTVTLTDVLVRAVASTAGRGLVVQGGATARADRWALRGVPDVGLYVSGAGSVVAVKDGVIRRTPLPPCAGDEGGAPPPCAVGAFDLGAGVYAEAVVEGDSLQVADHADGTGLQLARGGTSRISGLQVLRNGVGVETSDLPNGYDFVEAHPGLWLEGNERDRDEVPVPAIPEPLVSLPGLP